MKFKNQTLLIFNSGNLTNLSQVAKLNSVYNIILQGRLEFVKCPHCIINCQSCLHSFNVNTTPGLLSILLSLRDVMFQQTSACTYPVLWIFWWNKNVFGTCIAHSTYNIFLIDWELRHLRQDNYKISTIELNLMQFNNFNEHKTFELT